MRGTIQKSFPQSALPILKTGLPNSFYFLRTVHNFARPSSSSSRKHFIAQISFFLNFLYPNIEIGSDCDLFLCFTVHLSASCADTSKILLLQRLRVPRWDGCIFIFEDVFHEGGYTFFALEPSALNAFETLGVWFFSKHPVFVLK